MLKVATLSFTLFLAQSCGQDNSQLQGFSSIDETPGENTISSSSADKAYESTSKFEQVYASGIPGLIWLFPWKSIRTSSDSDALAEFAAEKKGSILYQHFRLFNEMDKHMQSTEISQLLYANVDKLNLDNIEGLEFSYELEDNPDQVLGCGKESATLKIRAKIIGGSPVTIGEKQISFCGNKVSAGLLVVDAHWEKYTRNNFYDATHDSRKFTIDLINRIEQR